MVQVYFPSWLFLIINLGLILASLLYIFILVKQHGAFQNGFNRFYSKISLDIIVLALLISLFLFIPLFNVNEIIYVEKSGIFGIRYSTEMNYYSVHFLNFLGHDQIWIKLYVITALLIFGLHLSREVLLFLIFRNKLYYSIHWLIVLINYCLHLIFSLIFDQTGTILYTLDITSGIDSTTNTYYLRDYELSDGFFVIIGCLLISLLFFLKHIFARKKVLYPSEQLYPNIA